VDNFRVRGLHQAISTRTSQPARSDQRLVLISPWPAIAPWIVILIGVILGRWLGYTPHLFVAVAALCLFMGLLKRP
jgi:hypothetical protein